MSEFAQLKERNKVYATTYGEKLPIMPQFSTVILTCVDARVDPAYFLGLQQGEALVFRNSGARITDDVENELAILWTIAKRATGENFNGLSLAIIHHTDCGFERLANPALRDLMHQHTKLPHATLEEMAIADHTQYLHDDFKRLQASTVVPKQLTVSCHILDLVDDQM